MRSRGGNSRPTLTAVGNDANMPPIHVDDYELWQSARRLSPGTIAERTRVLTSLYADTGVQPAHAQSVDIMRWIAAHPEWSQGTACTYYAYLNGWYKWLQAQDLRADNPMAKIGAPKTPDRLPRPVSDADVRALLTAASHRKTHAMILLAALQGMRVSEIAAVRAEDVDLDAGTLTVRGKGGTLHALPLHPRVAQYAWCMPRRGWWFPAPATRPGMHIKGSSVSQAISDTMGRCGVRGTPHALRHWFATRLLADGADIYLVRDLLRHKNVSTTAIYAKLPDEMRRDAIDRMDPWDRAARDRLLDAA